MGVLADGLGDLGHAERLAFVFVSPAFGRRGSLPARRGSGGSWRLTDVLGRQFARTPYPVSFARYMSVLRASPCTSSTAKWLRTALGQLRKIAQWMAG